ncbi:hypothetical protein KSF81_10785 [Siccirubricoccus sp. G192]|nr:hypothetical protein [Siccirubricoccus sp. G192]MBV1797499.1 hypothetical protein [Siccirubricoccus sp. G192]
MATPAAGITTSAPRSTQVAAAAWELRDDAVAHRAAGEGGVEVGQAVHPHPLHRHDASAEAAQRDILRHPRMVLVIGDYQADRDPHLAGGEERRLAEAEHRDAGHFPCGAEARVGDIAEQHGIEALGLGARHILQHLDGLDELQAAVLVADAAAAGDAMDREGGSGIGRRLQDAPERRGIGGPGIGPRQRLVPEPHRLPPRVAGSLGGRRFPPQGRGDWPPPNAGPGRETTGARH